MRLSAHYLTICSVNTRFRRFVSAWVVEIRVISFQVQEWIWKGSCKKVLFFPEEMKNSWKKRVTGKFPGSCQDLKQNFLLKTRGSTFYLNQDPIQDAAQSW
jgi:hypothetical protein